MFKLSGHTVDGGNMAYVVYAALAIGLAYLVLDGLRNSPARRARQKRVEDRIYRLLKGEPEEVLRQWEATCPEAVQRARRWNEWDGG